MWKLNDDLIKKINSYPEEKTDSEIWKELGINRHTVWKYRWQIADTLTKKDKKKLELLDHYSEKEIRDMINYVATSTMSPQCTNASTHLSLALS